MIAKIDKLNATKWNDIFKKAAEESGMSVHSLATFFEALDTLKAKGKYEYLRVPIDEPRFVIDADSRVIQVPKVFRDNGISVQGDHMAEILFFEIDRFFDDQDFSLYQGKNAEEGACFIQWRNNTTNDTQLSPAYAFDVTTEPLLDANGKNIVDENGNAIMVDKIIFGWIISESITEAQGNVDFAVRFVKANNITGLMEYSFSTLTATVAVRPALDMDVLETTIEDLTDVALHRKTYSGIVNTTSAAFPHVYENLGAQSDLDADGTLTLTISASSDDGGEIIYEWRKIGSEDVLPGTTAPSEDGTKTVGSCEVDASGTYYAYIGNKTQKGTRYLQSNSCTIPGADPISLAENGDIPVRGYATNEKNPDGSDIGITLTVNVTGENGTLSYEWLKDDDTAAPGADATSKSYKPTVEGKYHVVVKNTRNKDVTMVSSQTCDARALPVAPSGVTVAYDAENKVLKCNVEAPVRDLVYQWRELDSGKLVGATNANLALTEKQLESGKYYCGVKQVIFSDSDVLRRESDETYSSNWVVFPNGTIEDRQ